MTTTVRTITGWRGVLAVGIVGFHSGVSWLWELTFAGVSFFMLSSALLLTLRHPSRALTTHCYANALARRASKLLPLHWLAIVLLVGLQWTFADIHLMGWDSVETWLLNLTLLQAWSPVHEVHFSLNSVSWFLSALLFCYAVHPLLHWLLRQLGSAWQWVIVLALAAVLAMVLAPLDVPSREAVHVCPLSHLVDVALGIALAGIVTGCAGRSLEVSISPSMARVTLIEVGAMVLLAGAMVLHRLTDWVTPWEDNLLWMPANAVLLLVMMTHNGHEGLLGRLLLTPPLQWLGRHCMELYLLQNVAFLSCNYLLAPVLGHFGFLCYDKLVWMVWIVLLPLAWLTRHYFTIPVNRWLQSRLWTE